MLYEVITGEAALVTGVQLRGDTGGRAGHRDLVDPVDDVVVVPVRLPRDQGA